MLARGVSPRVLRALYLCHCPVPVLARFSHRAARLWAAAPGQVLASRVTPYLRPYLRDWAGRTTLLTAALALVYVGWLVTSGAHDPRWAVVHRVLVLPPALVAAVLAWRAAGGPAGRTPARRAWHLWALAQSLWCAADLAWLWMGQPAVSVADVGLLGSVPIQLAAFLTFPTAPPTRAERVQFALDAATVLLGGTMAVWYLMLGPAVNAGPLDTPAAVIGVAYPVTDLLLLFGCAAILLRRPPVALRASLGLLAAGVLVFFVGDLIGGSQLIADTYRAGGVIEACAVVGSAAYAAAAYHAATPPAPDLAPPRPHDARPRRGLDGSFLLPYGAVALGYALLLHAVRTAATHAPGGATSPLGPLVAGAGALTALVCARQVQAMRENVRLSAENAEQRSTVRHEARFRALVQHSSDVILVVDPDTTVRFASPAVTSVLGYAPAALVGRLLTALVDPGDVSRAAAFVAEAAAHPGAATPAAWRMRHHDGRWLHMETAGTNLLAEPSVGGVVLNTRDVTERTALQAELAHQAFHDPLTGLANRALFHDRVAHALAAAPRAPGRVAVLFLDLDDFKAVNDSLGHGAGDALLVQVAARLLGATRGCDTVARLGGDEFAVLLENVHDEHDVLVVADRVLAALRRPVAVGDTSTTAGGSVGVAQARDGEGVEELLRNADVAMYRAKAQGKGGYAVFAPEMYEALRDRVALEADLRRALDHDEFRVVYQPIVDLATERVVGVEALVRWQHPARGLVSPATFIPAAEETGLIVPLGRWVLRAACGQAAAWRRAAGPDAATDGLYVSVNLSARQLQDAGLVADVAAALADGGLAPGALLLEITESVVMQDSAANLGRLHELKALGVRLAIDDFGTGYSSLSYLQRFPVDVLKIDKAFVDRVAEAGHDAALARTIIALGDMLNLRTVAEGIEAPEQQARLAALGCALGQGYLFARPLPAADVETLLFAPRAVAASDSAALVVPAS